MKKRWTVLLAMLPGLSAFAQQDALVSQHVFNGIYTNPAYAGYKGDLFVQSYFRSQWVGVKGAPLSYALAADASTANGNVGLGIILAKDQIGAQSSTQGYLNYSYRLRVGYDEDSRLAFGISAGFMQLGIDGSKLNAVQLGDQAVPTVSQSTLIPNANFGIYYSNATMFAGASVTNILAKFAGKSKEAILNVAIPQPHFYLSGGALLALDDYNGNKFKPLFLLRDDTKGPTTLDLNGFWLMNQRLSLGAFYRTSIKLYQKNLQNGLPNLNAFGGIVEYFATPSLRIGYSYDQSLNRIGSYSAGSHEFSVGIYFDRGSSTRGGGSGDYSRRCYQF